MKTMTRLMACLAAGVMGLSCAQGAGLLVADGGFGGVLEIKEHDVKVTINNGVAVTRVTQVFLNREKRQVEALYTFPVPKGASVANFSMWINGKEMVGEVLEKERAREIYNSYKRVKRDPGLLEQKDYKTFEMRIFPIAAEAEQKVEVTYYQELSVDDDWVTYVYPLATVTRSDIQSDVTGPFKIDVEMLSAVPIAETGSPSHGEAFVVAEHTENYAQASLETKGGSLARDVVLSSRLARPQTGMDVITSKGKGEDGFFLLSLTVGEDLADLKTPMDYVFVLDISGSMANDGKLTASRGSVNAFVNSLAPEDRFEVLTFNVAPKTLFGSLVAADTSAQTRAATFLDDQVARGGTVLRSALQVAYKYGEPDRPLNVVILSDGMTEQKERAELLTLIGQRPRNAKVFCIGVGNEVNRPLLEQIAQDAGGLAAFISRGDDFERQAKAFRRKLMHPVATELAISFDGVEVYDLEPTRLPNLYHGKPVRVFGRYRSGGAAEVKLSASIQGRAFRKAAPMQFPDQDDDNPEIERMWAWHRIDGLLKQADRTGSRASVTDEVIDLGETYSIVTEYTSFLVLENDGEYKRWKIERRNASRTKRDRASQARTRSRLDALRSKASADLGPQAVEMARKQEQANAPTTRPSPSSQPASSPQNQRSAPRRRQSWDLDMGTGPVGPLFVIVAGWLGRRKRKLKSA